MIVPAIHDKNRLRWIVGPGLYCVVPLALTAAAFYGIWNDSFTNWDDDVYVTGNSLIHSLSVRNLIRMVSPDTFISGNYQPMTILSYALNYAAGRLNPAGYILADLLMHLLNVFLVFLFIRKISGSDLIASLCALLFGIHPMHAEPVAWISGRKELLYTFFYLSSALAYLSYREKRTGSATMRYSAACFLFVCSLLSKASAVTLPAVLFLIDYFTGRKCSVKMFIEKIPFIVPSIVLGLWAIKGQHDAGSLGEYGALSLFTRISIAAYSFMFYVVKFFVPLKLSACYPFPDSISTTLPLRYSLSPLFAVAAGVAAWLFRRSKAFVFGFFFFLINVVFILHFIPVGATVTADRFSYCSSIGLSFIVAYFVERGVASLRLKSLRIAVSAAVCIVAVAFGYAVHQRCKAWKNAVTLYTDVIEKYPLPTAYDNRGLAYYLNHDYARAIDDFNAAISRDASNADSYNDRGLAYAASGDHARAMEDYNRAIALNPGFAGACNNRGLDYYSQGDYARAMSDFERAISLLPSGAEAYYNRGNVLQSKGEYAAAVADYSRALSLNPDFAKAWYSQGCVYQAMNDLGRALACFTRTIECDAAGAQAYNSRGVVYCLGNDYDRAIADFNRAIALQPSFPAAYINRGNAYSSTGNFSPAVRDYSRAIELDPVHYPKAYYCRGLALRALRDPGHAAEDFVRACAMHLDIACRELGGRR